MDSRKSDKPQFGDGASPGKIFIGGLAKDTTLDTFVKYFGKYGEITDSVIMKDRISGRPRGFGFITYADPVVVDTVIAETHIINGKQVEIKRTIPKGAAESKDFRTKKIFVGGIPTSVTEEEFKDFFSKHGKVVEHEIIRDHVTKRSRGFGFIVFDNEQAVDDILVDGNMINMEGVQVEIKKAEPKKPSNPAPGPAFGGESRGRTYGEGFGGYGSSYSSFGGGGGFGPSSYRSSAGLSSRLAEYGGYGSGASEFGGRYGDFGGRYGDFGGRYGDLGGYRGEPSLGYSSRYSSYGSGLGGGYESTGLGSYGRGGGGGYESTGLGSYGRGGGGGYGSYGGLGSGGGFDSAPGSGYGGPGGLYGSRGGYGGSSRYHPYGR